LRRYAELAAALGDLYRPHIRVEDELIFPVEARILPPSELAVIGEEMRERRRDILRGCVERRRVYGPPLVRTQVGVPQGRARRSGT
jgi:hypothetical protein